MVMEVEFVDYRKIALNPDNPRIDIHNLDLQESLNEYGLQQPIIIRPAEEADVGDIPKGCEYVVIDGDCRLDSFRQFPPDDPLLEVGRDVIIRNLTREKAFIITIQANFMRKDFTLKEEVGLVDDLKKRGFSLREIEKLIRKSTRWVRDRQAIMKLDDEIVIKLYDKKITISEALGRSVLINTPLEVSSRQDSQASSLAGKLVQDGVVKQTISIEGPEEKSITKPPKYSIPTVFFDEFNDAFPNLKMTNIRHTKDFIAVDIVDEDDLTSTAIFSWLQEKHAAAKKEKKYEKSKISETDRTTIFTHEQFGAIETEPDFQKAIHSHQTIGDRVDIVWKSFKSKADALKWILEHKEDFPLTRWQLKKYTDLSHDEIQKIVEATLKQDLEERLEEIKEEPAGPSREFFMPISLQEYNAMLPSIKTLITDEEPVPEESIIKDRNILVFFRTDTDVELLRRFLRPFRDYPPPGIQYPAKMIDSVEAEDIPNKEEELKKHYPSIYEDLKFIQKSTKRIDGTSVKTIFEIGRAANRLSSRVSELKDYLKWLKKHRRISGGKEQHKKPCQQCLDIKWMVPQVDICGNCELHNRQQKNKSVAAASSGGRQ